MVNKIINEGKKLFTSPQTSVLSAATTIMIMIVASRVLGLIRQRILADFFAPPALSLFFAAFRLPDLIFEVLVFGTFSSAFIPVFTKALHTEGEKKAWDTAGRVLNIGLIVFVVFALLVGIFAERVYSVVAPGFSPSEIAEIASLARILFAAQGFFVVSYVLTGVLESQRRFLVPALAPIFYNIGIIAGTVFLTFRLGLTAPAIGVVIGAICHLLIQLPLAIKLGFRLVPSIVPTPEVKEIGALSGPRLIDLGSEQIVKTIELYLASLISTASYTYYTLAGTLQLLPTTLFGVSLAKAALPTLSAQISDLPSFRKTLFSTLYQIVFLVAPIATILMVLRIPIVRLLFGTKVFDWEATVQTSMVLSAFGAGIIFQAGVALLERGFYALHDTKTPVLVSLISFVLIIVGDFILVKEFSMPVWALAASFSIGLIFQAMTLYYLLGKKLDHGRALSTIKPIVKSFVAAFLSGAVMYFLLKFFDRSVWVKRLSFLGKIDASSLHFEKFVLDTRYTVNLLILTTVVSLIGIFIYLLVSFILKSEELGFASNIVKRILARALVGPPKKETELITPPGDGLN